MNNLDKLVDFNTRFWNRLAAFAITKIVTRTGKGIGVKNEKRYNFSAYSDKYAEIKSRGFKRLTGRAGAKGTKIKTFTQTSLNKQISPPNFELTGDTMEGLRRLETTKTSVSIGWNNEREATIVKGQEDRGKYIIAGIAENELDDILDEVGKEMDINWNKKVKNITIEVK